MYQSRFIHQYLPIVSVSCAHALCCHLYLCCRPRSQPGARSASGVHAARPPTHHAPHGHRQDATQGWPKQILDRTRCSLAATLRQWTL
eukprot:scaffold11543_cov128-Isochrysis_galbana.AAC.14